MMNRKILKGLGKLKLRIQGFRFILDQIKFTFTYVHKIKARTGIYQKHSDKSKYGLKDKSKYCLYKDRIIKR